MPKISIVIPVYNGEKRIKHTIASVLDQTMPVSELEVVFVDDNSTDRSVELIHEYCENYPQFKLIQLKHNSGSPSKPRNTGVRAANGDYIVFLDADDQLPREACALLYDHAETFYCDIVRGYLEVRRGLQSPGIRNRLQESDFARVSAKQLIRNLIAKQSTTIDGIFRREFLISNGIVFDENIRLGEDTLFFSECYAHTEKVKYVDKCVYTYIKREELDNPSSTQSYGSRELNNHLQVWSRASEILKRVDVDYVGLRLHLGFKFALKNIVNFSDGNIPEMDFWKLKEFIESNSRIIPAMRLKSRLRGVLDCILAGNYVEFVNQTRKRLLICGYAPLTRITPMISELQRRYEIKLDEWRDDITGDARILSKELLEWTDIILCEQTGQHVTWYANHKYPHQLMLVRSEETARQVDASIHMEMMRNS